MTKHKIVVKNACKRREGYTYHIDANGNLIEEKSIHLGYRPDASEDNFVDDNQGFESSGENKVSISDKLQSLDRTVIDGIRIGVLRRLLLVLQSSDSGVEDVMKLLKVSRRTAYDYVKVARLLK